MKKKLLALFLSLGMALSVAQPVTAHAADTEEETQGIASAEEKTLDTEYSVTWTKYTPDKWWNKVVIPEQGILGINFSEIDTEKYTFMNIVVNVYDENEKCIYNFKYGHADETATINIGLDKGTYYVSTYLDYMYNSYFEGKKKVNYKFTLNPTKYCEIERNNLKSTATPMKVDKIYTGYMGAEAGSSSAYRDNEDVYAINLKKGKIYKFSCSGTKGTTIVKILGKDTKLGTSFSADSFCRSPGAVFKSSYTGVYYIEIRNYSGEQYEYKTIVEDVTPTKPTLKSVKAGKKNATLNWSKERGTGYQIQYSVNKNFKNAKTIDVSSTLDTAKIKKLSSNKKYYVRVRSYSNYTLTYKNDSYKYSAWSNVKTVKAK